LATALGQIHRHGLIHKDIKPANVLVDDACNVRITGFGIASRLPRESQAPAPLEVIAGTLAYMAPEQTGRMNRSIDARSDLYSLGVTLYQMLTGHLPFAATDPLEWVHCHIARQPTPPAEHSAVPAPLSTITMKLLAKNAEERYQTASGLEADLRRCLLEWESHGCIDPFVPGTHDVSDQLLIPEKLYGREHEIDALLAAFDRVVAHVTPELVLVSGYSGIGKSSVVNELHKVLVAPRGLFASGKFDQYKSDIPYATLAQAFQTLVRQILAKSEAEVERWRGILAEALGPNGQLIVNLIPEIEFVIGKQPPVPDLPPQDAQNRFQTVFRRFLGAFARPEHPLALFLDDLQWLDAATLELLENLITDPDVRHLLLVGAYRDNEVNPFHPLMRTLGAIRKAGAKIQEIVLTPLTLDDVGQIVADSLHRDRDFALPLAQLVHEKTGGNPFFAIQFLTALAEEGLLAFDPDAGAWIWDLARIRAKGYTDNIVELMVGKLKRLPDATQDALKQLACLGNVVEMTRLTLVQGESEEAIHAALWGAARTGLIFRQEGSYAFPHDRVQEAAYALIPEEDRAAAHLRIGQMLASRTAPEDLDEKIFEIVNQLDRGAALIDLGEERERAAELNLIAAKRAKASTAYASAMNYLAAGRALLSEDSWERRYELTFALEYHWAECELLTADLAAAEERLTMLSRRAGNLVDIAAVASLQLTLYTTLDRSDRGVEVCLEFLRRGGVLWSPHPTKDEVLREYERIWSQLGSRSIEELIDLPLMSDPESCATLDVLTEVVTPALFTDENLISLVICRMVNLSLQHGNSDGSCFAYVWLGMILGPRFDDYRSGFRFGRLGHDLVEKRRLHRFHARAYMSFGNLVIPWTKHVQTGRDLVRRAFDAANKMGDLTFAAYSCNNLNTNLIATGDPLADVQREAEHGLDFARKARFGFVVDIITAQVRLVQTLRGLTPKFGFFNDEQFDESRFEHHLQNDPRLALPECWYWIRKLQARVFAEEYSSAVEASLNAQRLLWTSPSFFEVAEYHFYGALARAACCDMTPANERPQHFEALLIHHKQLAVWAENCPENFTNRAALAAAEIARLEGRALDAMHLYEQAIQSAREHGFVQNEALAHEVAARFYLARGLKTLFHAHLRNARNCYDRWGALGKLKQLGERYPHMHDERTPASPTTTIGTPVGQLDVETVIKASQALSSEIVLSKLIEKLMRIAVEHAGAGRGLLILFRGEAPQIEAEVTTGRSGIDVAVRQAAVTPSDLPQSALHYVIRTQKTVVLDDASVRNLYSDDEYVRQKLPRSVLCLPIVKQTKLVGVLYLENNLTPCAFTSDRVAVLELLASQAAISLENARLYSDLQRSEASLAEGQSLSHTGSFGWKVSTGEVSWSDEAFRIFEYDLTVTPGVDLFMQRVHPDDRALVQQAIDRASKEGTIFNFEHRLLMPDGRVKHLHVLAQALPNSSDNPEFVGAVVDTTATRQTEGALREQANLLNLTHETIFVRDMQNVITYWNHGAEEFYGWTAEEVIGKIPTHQLLQTVFSAPLGEIEAELLQTGRWEGELTHTKADGTRAIVASRWSLQRDEKQRPLAILEFNNDITERKRAEAELRESENRYRCIFESAGVSIWEEDFSQVKKAIDDLKTAGVQDFREYLAAHPEFIAQAVSMVKILDVNEAAVELFAAQDKQDLVASLDQVFTPETQQVFAGELIALAEGRFSFEAQTSLRTLKGDRISVVFTITFPAEPASLNSVLVSIMDITEQKRAEEALRQSQAELAHISRVTTMGEMTASLAHEVSQPLSAVVANGHACLRWLLADPPNLAKAREAIERIVRDGKDAGEIVQRVRALFKRTAGEKIALNLNEVISEVLRLLRTDILKKRIIVETHLDRNLPSVAGDRIQLQQVLLNLLLNGIEAMDSVLDRPKRLLVRSAVVSAEAVVEVQDHGVGIGDPEKAFEAFFTTKESGMGMGLAICRSIINAHHGRLWVESSDGPGATVCFTVPFQSFEGQ
jgi:PAS domain S-box-containing protein